MEGMQFEHAEFSAPTPAQSCANCQGPAAPEYFELNGKVFCRACRQGIGASLEKLRTSGSLGRAFLYGLGAAALGSIAFYAISAITGFQFGLIAVVIGFGVGKAVRKGSGSLGGRRYQIMAMLLTYVSIASTNVPPIVRFMSERGHGGLAPGGLLPLFGLALALPILNITRDFLGIIIIGIGLWEAWKFTREVKVEFKGPFTLAPPATAAL